VYLFLKFKTIGIQIIDVFIKTTRYKHYCSILMKIINSPKYAGRWKCVRLHNMKYECNKKCDKTHRSKCLVQFRYSFFRIFQTFNICQNIYTGFKKIEFRTEISRRSWPRTSRLEERFSRTMVKSCVVIVTTVFWTRRVIYPSFILRHNRIEQFFSVVLVAFEKFMSSVCVLSVFSAHLAHNFQYLHFSVAISYPEDL